MLSYIAHIPSSPLILENISKEKFSDFEKISSALQKISDEICESGCDTMVTITSGSYSYKGKYLINVSPKFDIEFSKFGDLLTHDNAYGEIPLAYYIRRDLDGYYNIQSITSQILDDQSSVCAMKLQASGKKYKILPICHYPDSAKELFGFGTRIRDVFEKMKNKIAVVTIGDLSRARKKISPTEAKKNDENIINILSKADTKSFIEYDPKKIKEFSVRGFGPIAISLGIVDGMNFRINILEYEQRYGVGMLVSKFVI